MKKQYTQARPRLSEQSRPDLDTSMYPNSQIDLSGIDINAIANYIDNAPPAVLEQFSRNYFPTDLGKFSAAHVGVANVAAGSFGPILPTSYDLQPPRSTQRHQPTSQLQTTHRPQSFIPQQQNIEPNLFPVMSSAMLPQSVPYLVPSFAASVQQPRTTSLQTSSQPTPSSQCTNPVRGPYMGNTGAVSGSSSSCSSDNRVISQPVPSTVKATAAAPNLERLSMKRRELDQVKHFVQEQRVAHERIVNEMEAGGRRQGQLARPPVQSPQDKQTAEHTSRDLSRINEASNLAELRRQAALTTREKIALSPTRRNDNDGTENPHVHSPNYMPQGTLHLSEAIVYSPTHVAAPLEKNATQSPYRIKPSPVVIGASAHGIVSGVFVSYPRRGSVKDEQEITEYQVQAAPLIRRGGGSHLGGPIKPDEYLELRKNLLNRSEQHAVVREGTRHSAV